MSQLTTDCPHCATKFRLTPEQLEIANGMVRCGKCINVFNANESLETETLKTESLETESLETESLETESLETESLETESLETESLETESLETESLETESLETDSLETESLETESTVTTPQETRGQSEEPTQLPAMAELLHNEFGAQQPSIKDNKSKPILAKLLLILGGAILLAAQYSYFFSRELSQTQAYRKPLISFCHYLGCTVELFQDIDRLAVRQFMVHSHSRQPGALTVDLIIENRALFDQPFPKIALRFADMQNQAVAERLIAASEYLSQDSQSLTAKPKLIPSGKQSRVSFSLLDPGVNAVNYSVALKE